ncbi:MAG: hypothetical protein MR938_05835 [Tenericutes bacterium]|nr:hypothetical protein [Mycoplasmatota bacterium]
MGKVKINNNLAALMLVASIFAGWGTLMIVTILMIIFCDLNDKIKPLIIKVVSFMAGITLILLGWDLVSNGIDLIFKLFNNIISIINSYLSYSNKIDLVEFQGKFVVPVTTVVASIGSIIKYLVTFSKFGFIIAIISGKAMKENAWTKKVNQYVSKFTNFANSFDESVNVNANKVENVSAVNNIENNINQNNSIM